MKALLQLLGGLALMLACAARAQEAMPHDHPPVGAADDQAAAMMQPPSFHQEGPSDEVPVHQVHVKVLDAHGKPVPDALVLLGVLGEEGKRDKVPSKTDANGLCVFSDLKKRAARAFRVTVPFEGANYGSAPFQLTDDKGVLVTMIRFPVTRESRGLIQSIGQTVVEFREDRIHVTGQSRLMNLGLRTIVFEGRGKLIALPSGYQAFGAQAMMTDQKLIEESGKGMWLSGSIPPGTVELAWAFDLPLKGKQLHFSVPIPWPTVNYRVFSEAPPGMTLNVDEMPKAGDFDNEGRRILATHIQRQPTDPPFERVTITLDNIPGPHPVRWWLLLLSCVVLLLGGWRVMASLRLFSASKPSADVTPLITKVTELDQEHAKGEVGPESYAQERAQLIEQIAVALYAQEQT